MILFVYLSIKLLTYFLSGQGRSWIYLGSLHVGRTYPIPTQDNMIQSSRQLVDPRAAELAAGRRPKKKCGLAAGKNSASRQPGRKKNAA